MRISARVAAAGLTVAAGLMAAPAAAHAADLGGENVTAHINNNTLVSQGVCVIVSVTSRTAGPLVNETACVPGA
jgi:hypothetical protein